MIAPKADFQSEMAAWQSAFDSMARYTFIDLDRVFVVGLGLGSRGGSVTTQKGSEYFRKLAARRKHHIGGRPPKESA